MRTRKPSLVDAINSLNPNAQFTYSEDGIEWAEGTDAIPQETLDAKLAEFEAEYAASGYAIARRDAYPSIKDQLDMMFHDQVNGTTTWKDAIQAVKDANPKPTE